MTTVLRLPPSLRNVLLTPFPPVANPRSSRCFSTSIVMQFPGRSYADAITLLESLQSNRVVVSSVSSSSRDKNLDAIPEMLEWTRRAGYDVKDFAKRGLRCIHVAGTKGKGSTCLMVENILLQYRGQDSTGTPIDRALGKIGLYTSPHLVTVRERIRIDGIPISEPLFTRYFFELWDRISSSTPSPSPDLDSSFVDAKPGYFRYLTLLALHTFLEEGVETAIIECGIGGRYDSTNILPPEAVSVSAITKLGIDHIGMLGTTIESIAGHKAGIFKPGVLAYTVEQYPEAQAVLELSAADVGSELVAVKRLPVLQTPGFRLGLGGDSQKDNASLAIAISSSHLRAIGIAPEVPSLSDISASDEVFPHLFLKGLESASWPGRWEVRKEGNIDWLIDGAHTAESLKATASWYLEKLADAYDEERPPTSTMLIFNQQDRDAKALLKVLTEFIDTNSLPLKSSMPTFDKTGYYVRQKSFTFAAFCTNVPFKSQVTSQDTILQEKIAAAYARMTGKSLHMCYTSVEEAVELARQVSQGDERVIVLVTGSLHLVGGLIEVLEGNDPAPIDKTLSRAFTSRDGFSEVKRAAKQEDVKKTQAQNDKTIEAIDQGTSPLLVKSQHEIAKEREELFQAFLATISPESRANIMEEDLIEPPTPVDHEKVQYTNVIPQPYHTLETNGPRYPAKSSERLQRRASQPKAFIEAFFAKTKNGFNVSCTDQNLGNPKAFCKAETNDVNNKSQTENKT